MFYFTQKLHETPYVSSCDEYLESWTASVAIHSDGPG